jgi:catechol 2,3-dioxygenase-like lactoylglutathione lyase family enzyme
MGIIGTYHHVHLISEDPRKTAEWYAEFLGGEIVRDDELRGARNVRVHLGECLLNIRGLRATDNIGGSAGEQRLGIDHFCFQVDDIEGLLEAFAAKGGEIPEPLFELPSGNRAAFVAGPDGVVMELIQLAG